MKKVLPVIFLLVILVAITFVLTRQPGKKLFIEGVAEKADEEETAFITHRSDLFPIKFTYPDYLQIEKKISGENFIERTDINSSANITLKDNNKRVFVIAANELNMLGHAMLYTRDEKEIAVGGRKALQMKKDNMKDEDDFDFFVQTIVEFPAFFYVFLSDGENPLYREILSSVKFSE